MISKKHQLRTIHMLDQCNNLSPRKQKMAKYGTKAEIEELVNRFTYHTPHGDQAERYGILNEAARDYGQALLENCPPSPERDEAMRLLTLARMMGNSAIAINESDPSQQ